MKKRTASSSGSSARRSTNTKVRSASPAPKRDNVLGRRPSTADPLGEQPGTLPAEKEPSPVNEKDIDLRRPEDQITNTDVSDRPFGGM